VRPGAVDDHGGRDLALGRAHPRHPAGARRDRRRRRPGADVEPALSREVHERLQETVGVGRPVIGAKAPTDQVVGSESREKPSQLRSPDHLALHAERPLEGDRPRGLRHGGGTGGDEQIAVTDKVDGAAQHFVSPSEVRIGKQRQPDVRLGRELVTHAPGGFAGSAGAQGRFLFQQHHSKPGCALEQVVGHGGTDHSAADHDDVGRGQRRQRPPGGAGSASRGASPAASA
jgi:hypothetical protein